MSNNKTTPVKEQSQLSIKFCSTHHCNMSKEVNNLITISSKLNLNQWRIINELVEELTESEQGGPTQSTRNKARGQIIGPNVGVRTQRRIPNHKFISKNSAPLASRD